MRTRELTRSPRILPLYLRAAATLVPGANHLPGLPGGSGRIPELELMLRGARADPERLASYRELCGYANAARLPVTYPHVLAFPLHMALMADPGFPFGAPGLIHVENRIACRRPIEPEERLDMRVHATQLVPARRGRSFSIVTEAHAGDEPVWEEHSTMLWRGGGDGERRRDGEPRFDGDRSPAQSSRPAALGADVVQSTWRVPGDIGRRYGAISGDRNPIHMYPLVARAFGFPRAIAHGMWTKARSLAALEDELPEAFTTDVRFVKPLLLPASASFECERLCDDLVFSLRGESNDALHLGGRVQAASEAPQ
jgi:acyl dehydratase